MTALAIIRADFAHRDTARGADGSCSAHVVRYLRKTEGSHTPRHGVDEGLDGIPGRHDVDDGVPETHQREHETGGVVKGERHGFRVDEGIDAIDRGRNLASC